MFDAVSVFRTLYRDVLHRVNDSSVIAFEESNDVILRSGFINLIENRFLEYFTQSIQGGGRSSVEIHRETLDRFKDR